MTLDAFLDSLTAVSPPDVAPLLRALWHDKKGDWDRAHQLAQDIDSRDAAWVHAYLHRREGDEGNALYWYRRAGRTRAAGSLEEEWQRIVAELLAAS